MKSILYLISSALLVASCSGSSEKRSAQVTTTPAPSAIESRYAAWRASLTDSVDSLETLQSNLQLRIDSLTAVVDGINRLYEIVSDPILVEKYLVVRGWRGYDTTSTPGIFGRLLEDGTIEIIVTRTGSPFTSIALSSGGEKINSNTVPAGSALNTSVGSLQRVCFNNAVKLADFVSRHRAEVVTLTYSSGGSMNLTARQKQMLADLARLPVALEKLNELQRQSAVIYNKIDLFRSEIENNPKETQTVTQ